MCVAGGQLVWESWLRSLNQGPQFDAPQLEDQIASRRLGVMGSGNGLPKENMTRHSSEITTCIHADVLRPSSEHGAVRGACSWKLHTRRPESTSGAVSCSSYPVGPINLPRLMPTARGIVWVRLFQKCLRGLRGSCRVRTSKPGEKEASCKQDGPLDGYEYSGVTPQECKLQRSASQRWLEALCCHMNGEMKRVCTQEQQRSLGTVLGLPGRKLQGGCVPHGDKRNGR